MADFDWVQGNGELRLLQNVGREGHAYLVHILYLRDDLASHAIFNQALPDLGSTKTVNRLQHFDTSTGLLGLAEVTDCGCDDCYMGHLPFLKEIWAMMKLEFCSPSQRFSVFLKGAFLVSKHRLLSVPVKVYASLLELLAAPEDHWVHRTHSFEDFKHARAPLAGHV